MQTTGQLIVNKALTRLGILEQGGTPSVSDSNDALGNLNDYWDSASIDEGWIFAEQKVDFVLPAGTYPIPIGPAAAAPFNVPAPTRIYKAFIVTGTQQNEIKVVGAEEYFGTHNDLTATSSTPDELYPDYNIGSATGQFSMSLYPWPTATPMLRLVYAATFTSWTLNVSIYVPPAYSDALAWIVAFRSLSTFGAAVSQEIAQNVMGNAKLADAKIREMNALNRKMPPAAMVEPAQMLAPPQAAAKQ